jgi:tetratricopeptide (TPR) repeat protein
MKTRNIVHGILFAVVAGAALQALPLFKASLQESDPLAQVEAAIKEDRLSDALKQAESAAALSPLDSETQALYGLALLRWGDFGRAETALDIAISLDPENADAHLGKARLAAGSRDIELASRHLLKAATSQRFRGEALLLLAGLQADHGNPAAALAASEAAIGLLDYLPAEELNNLKASMEFWRSLGGTVLYQVPEPFQKTSVDLVRRGEHVFIGLKINGEDAGLFFLDTAYTGGLAVNESLAERLGLRSVGSFKHSGIGGNRIPGSATLLERIEIGRLEIGNVPAAVVRSAFFTGGINGIVGRALLQQFHFTIDYPGLRLQLYRFSRPDLLEREIDPDRILERAPLHYSDLPLVMASFDGEDTAPFAVDTASAHTLVDSGYIRENLRHKVSLDPVAAVEIAGIDGSATAKPVSIGSLSVGGASAIDFNGYVLDLSAFRVLHRRVCGVLGADFLKRFRLHFNFLSSELILETAP